MSTAHFRITQHTVPASHIRQYYRATADPLDELKLAVNQYTPFDNPNPQPGDLTILAAHANGVGKELYEPLFDDIWEAINRIGKFKIRAIWISDVAWQGQSSVLNEDKLGTEPSWYDHPRDLLNLVNHFRKDMVPPIFGLGHSMGGNHMTNVALMHPRLLAGLVLVDPVIQDRSSAGGNFMPVFMSMFRRDWWPSREAALESFHKNPFYAQWDERVLKKHVEYNLRDLPTALYPEGPPSKQETKASSPPANATLAVASATTAAPVPPSSPRSLGVTLRTTKHQEVFTFSRLKVEEDRTYSIGDAAPGQTYNLPRRTHPDIPDQMRDSSIYRPEPLITFNNLPFLRPRCLYISATESPLSVEILRSQRMKVTGTGVGGNGGKEVDGGTQEVLAHGAGHFVPFERPTETAGYISSWLDKEMERWKAEDELNRKEWEEIKKRDGGKGRFTMSKHFVDWTAGFAEDSGIVKRRAKKGAGSAEPKL